jgi:Wiskott-Aldrich syndrome protein
MVTSIHEALPPEIAAATGRGLALGSPIDSISPPTQWGSASPTIGTPPPPLPVRVEVPASPTVDPFARAFEAPDPWAAPTLTGESFFQSAQSTELVFSDTSTKPKRRLLRGRKAAKEAQARIAAEFAAPPPPPGFYSSGAPTFGDVPPPPFGFGSEGPSQDFGMPTAWSDTPVAVGPEMSHESAGLAPLQAPGFAAEHATPSGWFGSAAEGATVPPPPPAGFASDLAEPAIAETSWGTAPGGGPQSDFVFDEPAVPPPPGFGPLGYEGLSAVPPPPSGFGTDMGDAPPPPPPGFGPLGYEGLSAVPPPPSGFGTDMGDAPPPPPPGFGADAMGGPPPPPPPGFGPPSDHGAPPAPPGYGNPTLVTSSAEAFNDVQDVNSLGMQQAYEAPPEPLEDERFLAGTGTDRTSYASVPPITPDFFARSASRGSRR